MSGPYRFSFEPLFLVLVAVAAVALRPARRAVRPGPSARAGPRCRLRLRPRARRPAGELAARDDLGPLPAPRPPAPERADRRLGPAAPDHRADPLDAPCASPPRAAGRSHRLTRPAVALLLWLLTWYGVHLAVVLRLGAPRRLAAQPRARAAPRRRARLLVGGARRAAPARGARDARLPRDRLHHRALALARLHLRDASVLRVLRRGAAALGALAGPRPEPGRDPDERRADEHHLRSPSPGRSCASSPRRRKASGGSRRGSSN